MINTRRLIISYPPQSGFLFIDEHLPRVGDALCIHASMSEKDKVKSRVHLVSVNLLRVPHSAVSSGCVWHNGTVTKTLRILRV
jgi:hypothetical protein